jgi:hypothetical protein
MPTRYEVVIRKGLFWKTGVVARVGLRLKAALPLVSRDMDGSGSLSTAYVAKQSMDMNCT